MERFPDGFWFGASTSSYQTEGDNKGSALWDWEVKKGWERSGEAAGSWERFDEDLACLKKLGADAYRFSLEWSRVQPEPDRFDDEALARYAGWARKLKAAGIRPIVCFHHFSEPKWLLERHPEGWTGDQVGRLFLAYVEAAAGALDAVTDFIPFNEPMVFALGAYGAGIFPPGRLGFFSLPGGPVPAAGERLARAHNEAYALLKRLRPGCTVGVAHNVAALEPAKPGHEPACEVWDELMHLDFLERTRESLDYIGVNYYTRIFVSRAPWPVPLRCLPGYAEVEKALGPLFKLLGGRRDPGPRTGMGWEVVPEGLERVLLKLWRRYQKPLVVTENGVAAAEGVDRAAFLRDHLAAMARAMDAGVDVRGYLYWSLTDNWEWGTYKPRFGLFTRERKAGPAVELFAQVARERRPPKGKKGKGGVHG